MDENNTQTALKGCGVNNRTETNMFLMFGSRISKKEKYSGRQFTQKFPNYRFQVMPDYYLSLSSIGCVKIWTSEDCLLPQLVKRVGLVLNFMSVFFLKALNLYPSRDGTITNLHSGERLESIPLPLTPQSKWRVHTWPWNRSLLRERHTICLLISALITI